MPTANNVLTENERTNFERLINDVLNHPFLHCHPYYLDDDTIISEAEQRAGKFQQFPNNYIEFLDQCCSFCNIGKIRAVENPCPRDGAPTEYQIIPLQFSYDGINHEFSINKSDFNPRKYLTVCGFGSDLFLKKSCEKYTDKDNSKVKTSSLVNNEAEIEKYQNQTALMAYSFQIMSGFGSIRMAYRLYTFDDDDAKTIREQILLTQQYILCSLINFPQSIAINSKLFDETIFNKYRPIFEQMYESVCLEIKYRGLEPNIKEDYIPTIIKSTGNILKPIAPENILPEDIMKRIVDDDSKLSDYVGLYAIEEHLEYDHMLDRRGNIFNPRFRNSTECIEDSDDYLNVYFSTNGDDGLIVCHANDINPYEYNKNNNDWEDEDEDTDPFSLYDEPKHEFYYDADEDCPTQCEHYYMGLINKYGHTIFELKSLTPFGNNYDDKFRFKVYDEKYVIICLNDSYDKDKGCLVRCGAIDIKSGTLAFPLIFTENEIRNRLSWGGKFIDERYYRPGWIIAGYNDNLSFFNGPMYEDENDILEQGKYAGYTIKDALYYHGKEVLYELIFKDQIFFADTVFDQNIAKLSSIEESIKLHQDNHLEFNYILDMDDVIRTRNGFNSSICFSSLYEGKTISEAIIDEHGMFYIKNLVSNGVLKIDEEVIYQLMEESPEVFAPLQEAFQKHQAYLEGLEDERKYREEEICDRYIRELENEDFNRMMNDLDAWSNID